MSNANEVTLTIDGKPVDYIRKDSVQQIRDIGTKRMIAEEKAI